MGPNRNLRLQLHFARHIVTDAKNKQPIDVDDARELAELVIELDKHLVGAGELPARWAREEAPEEAAEEEAAEEEEEEATEEEADEEEEEAEEDEED